MKIDSLILALMVAGAVLSSVYWYSTLSKEEVVTKAYGHIKKNETIPLSLKFKIWLLQPSEGEIRDILGSKGIGTGSQVGTSTTRKVTKPKNAT